MVSINTLHSNGRHFAIIFVIFTSPLRTSPKIQALEVVTQAHLMQIWLQLQNPAMEWQWPFLVVAPTTINKQTHIDFL